MAKTIEACGSLDVLEQLQHHASHEIYEKVVNILESYFNAEEAVEDARNDNV